MAAASSDGMGDLEGFAGAAEVHVDDVNDLVSRCPRSGTTGRGASWALATTAARCNWRRLA